MLDANMRNPLNVQMQGSTRQLLAAMSKTTQHKITAAFMQFTSSSAVVPQ
jgi:hypothetical protein